MTVHYRQLEPGEEPAVVSLWAEEIDVSRDLIAAEFASDDQRLAHTRVAVDEEGEIVSAVHYFLRLIRDSAGRPQRVGAVAGVATRATARGQGLAGALIEQTLAAMEAEGCSWSLLFTEINGFYEKFGWRTFRTGYRQGMLAQRRLAAAGGYTTRPFNPQTEVEGWAPLAAIYDAYNANRPLTTVRDLAYWRTYAALRLQEPEVTIFAACREERPEQVVGYSVSHIGSETIGISELGFLPGHADAAAVLFRRVQREAQEREIHLSRVFLPRESLVDDLLGRYFQAIQSGSYEMLMGRPLAPGYTMADIEATFQAPGAIAWPADDF